MGEKAEDWLAPFYLQHGYGRAARWLRFWRARQWPGGEIPASLRAALEIEHLYDAVTKELPPRWYSIATRKILNKADERVFGGARESRTVVVPLSPEDGVRGPTPSWPGGGSA